MKFFAKLLLASCLVTAVQGAPVFEKSDLFHAGEGGYAGYRIPALAVTPQATVLAACEARKDDRSDWGHIDIFLRRSTDGGLTWKPPRRLIGRDDLPPDLAKNSAHQGKEGNFTINNPTWIADSATGETHLLFCAEYARSFIVTTRDGGATFSAPHEITAAFETFRTRDAYPWKVIAIGPGHGVRLATGRLVAAVWLATSEGGNAHRPSACATIYSDDHGATWHAGDIVARNPDPLVNPSETAVVEAAPGRVMLSIRSETARNRRAQAWSADGVTGWSQPTFVEELWEPVCMAGLTRIKPATAGRPAVLLFSNPASLEKVPGSPDDRTSRIRQNLTLRASHDGGATWPDSLVLEPGPSAYSDLAVSADGTILCFYEQGETGPYEKLTIARVPAAALIK